MTIPGATQGGVASMVGDQNAALPPRARRRTIDINLAGVTTRRLFGTSKSVSLNAVVCAAGPPRDPHYPATGPLTPRVALHLGMDLAPVQVEHAHGDGARSLF